MTLRGRSLTTRVLGTILFSLLVLLAVRTAFASVDLIYFLAETEADKIRLEWETATELDNAGFAVLRSLTGGTDPSQYTMIPVIDALSGESYTFIPARGDDLAGALYTFYDENVTIGTRYYYFLQDVDSSNVSSFEGPREAVAGQTPTPLPSVTPTRTNTPPGSPSGSPSATPATATPTRTRTPTPANTSAIIVSITPARTNTPTSSPIPSSTPEGPTATFDPQVSSFDLTLTALYASVTVVPTASPTRPPKEIAAASTSIPTEITAMQPSAPETERANPLSARTLVPIILAVVASGGLLTWGVLLIARRSGKET